MPAKNELSQKIDQMSSKLDDNFAELKDSIDHIKDHVIQQLLDENKKLTIKVNWMANEISKIKREDALVDQKMRENNIDIAGIPNSVPDDMLEEQAIKIMNKIIPSPITSTDLQAWHRLPNMSGNKATIIKFVNRKNAEAVYENKFKLKRLDFTNIGLPNDCKVFINQNLCKRLKSLSYHCRKLRTEKKVSRFIISMNGSMKIFIGEQHFKVITEDDLVALFPDYNFGFSLVSN